MTKRAKIGIGIGLFILALALVIFVPGGLLSLYRRNQAQTSPNMAAFMMMIRWGEGTDGPDGYNMLAGGKTFTDMSQHPNILNPELDSTAAGAFQFIYSTWQALGEPDFSQASQDAGFIKKADQLGALGDILNGNITDAINELAGTWASLPGGVQQRHTMQECLDYYTSQGGTLNS